MTTTGFVGKSLATNLLASIRSTANYTFHFTFIIKAKRIITSSRTFTSSKTNKILGWLGTKTKCAWMNENIYGIDDKHTDDDGSIHTFILINDNDIKTFDDDKTEMITRNNGSSSWGGNVVIGIPIQNNSLGATDQFYKVMCFDKVLSKYQIEDIHDSLLA